MSTVDFSGAEWRKSSRSGGGNNGSCVEIAYAGRAVGVRDSKNPGAGILVFSAVQWAFFLRGFRA
ncbi:MAG TPA: DUF397 domain-containing protein [Lentzea sp.]|nr:DUF397 domain-containing protein [Lentzea sp.]HUQ54396.1 DUF397 domain-containing protein [Lentzea sp.]